MKIFIIDDDHSSNFLTEQMLLLEGVTHDIEVFLSVREAMDAFITVDSDSTPDVILLDLNMPVMDGWEFLSMLALQNPLIKDKCAIYILTSSLDPLDAARAEENLIVTGLIRKPLQLEDINLIFSQHSTTK